MNNKEILSKHLEVYSLMPDPISGYYGLSEQEFFPDYSYGKGIVFPHHRPNSFKTLVEEYKSIIKRFNDPFPVIDKHLKIINQIVKNKDSDLGRNEDLEIEEKLLRTICNEAFKETFHVYITDEVEADYLDDDYPLPKLLGTYYGLELAKYRMFLEKQLIAPSEESSVAKDLTLSNKILLLEVLGIMDIVRQKIEVAEHRYEILSMITGKSKDNIKKVCRIPLMDQSKTKSSKQFLNKLKADLERMSLGGMLKEVKKLLDS